MWIRFSALAGRAAAFTARCTAAQTKRGFGAERIGSVDAVPEFNQRSRRRGANRLMGFGHRVYKSYDPRAKVISALRTRLRR